MTVESIKEAIVGLSGEERGALAAWIIQHEYDDWDNEMVKDFSAGGRGDRLLDELKRDIRAGKFAPLEQGLETRKKQP